MVLRLVLLILCLCGIGLLLSSFFGGHSKKKQSNIVKHPLSFYEIPMRSLDGTPLNASRFKDKVVLIVNVASRCGFTNQYEGLQALYTRYHKEGFEILAVPSNDFANQEPGSNQEIAQFCSVNFGTTFPMTTKLHVKGKKIHPLYQFLTMPPAPFPGSVKWNFTKFLIDKDGTVIARYSSVKKPLSRTITTAIEQALVQND